MDAGTYFDNAATTPIDPRVVEAMIPYFGETFGNAHSLHSFGGAAMAAVDKAREQVSNLIGADAPDEIVFTSGATEANNWIVRAFPDLVISPFEHSSLNTPALNAKHALMPNEGLSIAVPQDAPIVSLMKVNNELGTVFEPEKLATKLRLVHSDITQAVGKIPVMAHDFDYASFSGHKFYGPKGIGALYAKGANFPAPLLTGGDQEHGLRAGTLNVASIVGMGAAAEIAQREREANANHVSGLREIVLEGLDKALDFQVNGGDQVSPYILSLSFYGMEGETLVIELDRLGFALSSGAACSAHSTAPSHVLTAIGLEPEWLRGTIRISFGRFNTKEAAQKLGKALTLGAETINNLNV
jgi:cysteine desulfurase